jgi:hypothetical protein
VTATKTPLTPRTVGGLIPKAVGEVKRERRINMLLYGEPGAGKTHLAGSSSEVPEFRKVLHLDVEGGSMTLDRKFPLVETVRIADWEDLYNIYQDLLHNGDGYYNTVILDNLTEAQKLCQRQVMEHAFVKAQRTGKQDEIEPEVPRQRDWGVMYERLMLMVRDYRDLPLHFIWTAHVKEDITPRTKERKLKPALSGQAKQDLVGVFDIVGYLRTERLEGQNVRVLSTQDHPDYVAKERDTDLPENLGNTTMEEIFSYIPKDTENV